MLTLTVTVIPILDVDLDCPLKSIADRVGVRMGVRYARRISVMVLCGRQVSEGRGECAMFQRPGLGLRLPRWSWLH